MTTASRWLRRLAVVQVGLAGILIALQWSTGDWSLTPVLALASAALIFAASGPKA